MTDFTPQTNATFVGIDFGGVTHYRLMLPARSLKASLFVRTSDLEREKLVGSRDSAVSVYSMPRSVEMIDECMQIIAMNGRSLIIDIDDCLRAVVEDGRHGAVEEWRKLLPKHEWLLARADIVTCSTEFLADYARSCGATDVRVIPNALDIERWNIKREPRHKSKTIVGWAGSYGHEGALEAHAPALLDLLRRRPEVALASVGPPLSRYFPEEIRRRIHDVPFMPMSQYVHVITQFHINIGPTEETDFYRAKSDLRALEAFASDSVFIGGYTTYGDTMDAAGVGRNAVHVPEVLVACIEDMIDDRKANHDARKAQARYVRENRLIEHTAPLWAQAIADAQP